MQEQRLQDSFDVEELNAEILEIISSEEIRPDDLLAGRCPGFLEF